MKKRKPTPSPSLLLFAKGRGSVMAKIDGLDKKNKRGIGTKVFAE
jgi:hypothetical protein